MFKCKTCGSEAFRLVVHPDFQGTVEMTTNAHDEVVIRAGEQEFIADLMFINRFGVCAGCGATKQWAYHFPGKPLETAD